MRRTTRTMAGTMSKVERDLRGKRALLWSSYYVVGSSLTGVIVEKLQSNIRT